MRPTFIRPDGGISQVVCAAGIDPEVEAGRVAAANPDWAYVGRHAPPATRRFRQCWRHAGGALGVDIPLARLQREGELRAERDAKLVAADVMTMKALDAGTTQQRQEIAAYKKSLRDLPATIATELLVASDAGALAAYMPTWPTLPAIT